MLKVYFQYPWSFPDSPYYKNLLKYTSDGVKYLNASVDKHGVKGSKTLTVLHSVKRIVAWARRNILPLPNIIYLKKGSYDIAHCAHCLPINSTYDYVVDVEDWWSLGGCYSRFKWGKKLVRKLLIKENCKKILVWTHATETAFLKNFPEIADKTVVVYPAVPAKNVKRKEHDVVTVLFIARYFWNKGGLIALEVMNQLKNIYGKSINCIVRADVPSQIKKKYNCLEYIDFVEDLDSLYTMSDVFLYPSFADTFGFAQLEAMSYKLPVVTVDGFARKEIVEDGKTGFVIDAPDMINCYALGPKELKVVQNLVKCTIKLIENKKLRVKMGLAGYREIKSGKFSIEKHNEKLKRIYEEALRS